MQDQELKAMQENIAVIIPLNFALYKSSVQKVSSLKGSRQSAY